MKEIECRKGLTLVELMIVIAILGIFAALFIPRFLSNADGMELQKVFIASDDNIRTAARAMRTDIEQTVVVMIYAATWTATGDGYDFIEALMKEQTEVMAKFVKLGISSARVSLLIANKGGLEYYDTTPAPAHDCIYLYLE